MSLGHPQPEYQKRHKDTLQIKDVFGTEISETIYLLGELTLPIDSAVSQAEESDEELVRLFLRDETLRELPTVTDLATRIKDQLLNANRRDLATLNSENHNSVLAKIKKRTAALNDAVVRLKTYFPKATRPLMYLLVDELNNEIFTKICLDKLREIKRVKGPSPEAEYEAFARSSKSADKPKQRNILNTMVLLAYFSAAQDADLRKLCRRDYALLCAQNQAREDSANIIYDRLKNTYLMPDQKIVDVSGFTFSIPDNLPSYLLCYSVFKVGGSGKYKDLNISVGISRVTGDIVLPYTFGLSIDEILNLYDANLFQSLRVRAFEALESAIKMDDGLQVMQFEYPEEESEVLKVAEETKDAAHVATEASEGEVAIETATVGQQPMIMEKSPGARKKLKGMDPRQAIAVFKTFGVTVREIPNYGSEILLVMNGADGENEKTKVFPKPGGHGGGKENADLPDVIAKACKKFGINIDEFRRKAAAL